MNMLLKCCFFFFPFREKPNFPTFDDRWTFFCEATDNGLLYWDSSRFMQNIQNVENSKKILPQKDQMMLSTLPTNLDLGLEKENYGYVDDEEDDYGQNTEDTRDNQVVDEDNLDLIMEEYEMQGFQTGLLNSLIKEGECGTLNKKMKDLHIIDDPICTDESVLLNVSLNIVEEQRDTEPNFLSSNSYNNMGDV
jgi:hypothetical protein